MMLYFIEWNDGTIEYFDTPSERFCRLYALEDQGYLLGSDFVLGVKP